MEEEVSPYVWGRKGSPEWYARIKYVLERRAKGETLQAIGAALRTQAGMPLGPTRVRELEFRGRLILERPLHAAQRRSYEETGTFDGPLVLER